MTTSDRHPILDFSIVPLLINKHQTKYVLCVSAQSEECFRSRTSLNKNAFMELNSSGRRVCVVSCTYGAELYGPLKCRLACCNYSDCRREIASVYPPIHVSNLQPRKSGPMMTLTYFTVISALHSLPLSPSRPKFLCSSDYLHVRAFFRTQLSIQSQE